MLFKKNIKKIKKTLMLDQKNKSFLKKLNKIKTQKPVWSG
jgi:hypothetical protein